MSEQAGTWGEWEHDEYEPDLYIRRKFAPDGSMMADYLGLDYLNKLEAERTRLETALRDVLPYLPAYKRGHSVEVDAKRVRMLRRLGSTLFDPTGEVRAYLAAREALAFPSEMRPQEIVTYCPMCCYQHIDDGEWETTPHKTHLCGHCGHKWRPMNIATVGVPALASTTKGEGHSE